MLIDERMSKPVITAHADLPVQDALALMHSEKIRRLPVIDPQGHLVGIVSERDLLHASPSDATSLSMWELNYLLSKLKISDIMTKEVITISSDTPLEEAARIMADNKIGGLPVTHAGKVVGMITETDVFKSFLEIMGARDPGVRVTALVRDAPGELAKVSSTIHKLGGNILACGTFLGKSVENRELTIKVSGLDLETIRSQLEPLVEEITDIREVKPV
jgi:acetoin utilization protein AcuB